MGLHTKVEHFLVLIATAGVDHDASIVRTNRTIHDTQDDLADSPHRLYFGRAVRSHPKGRGTLCKLPDVNRKWLTLPFVCRNTQWSVVLW